MAEAFSIELRIGPAASGAGNYVVEATLEDGGSFTGGRLALDRAALLAAQLDADAYGRLLTDALLDGPIARAYDQAAACAETLTGGRLRVRLRIDATAAELHALAWERLRHRFRGRDIPMATSALTPFSRYVGLEAAETVPLAERPVRLLVAVANPADSTPSLAPIDVTREIELLSEALGVLTADGPLAVTVLPGRTGLPEKKRTELLEQGYKIEYGPASLDAVRRLLLDHHVLHLVSHGSYRDGEAALHLEDDDGRWQPVSDRILVPALAAAGVLPHAAILVACESAARGEDEVEPFVGLGPKLVEAGVPAVVAMREQIAMRSAQQVMGDFYCRLMDHGEVDRALNEARLMLVDDPLADWATPVLFSRLTDGQLFAPGESNPDDPATAVETSESPAPAIVNAVPVQDPIAHPVGPSDGTPGTAPLNIGTSGPIEVGAARDGEPGAQSILGDWRDVSLWWRRTPDVAKVLVGLVTIIGTIVAIINRVGGADPEPTAIPILTIGIELGEPTLQERGAAVLTEGADPAAVLTMNVSGLIRGPDGQGVELTWQMVNASDLRIIDLGDVWVPGPEYRLAAVTSQGTGEGEQWSQSFNVPLPLRGTCVLVRVSAYDEDGTMLQFVDSKPIDTHHPDNRLCATAATTGQSRSFVGGILP